MINTVLQKIFSVTNENTHKVLTIAGFKFKFKDKQKILLNQILKIQNNLDNDSRNILNNIKNITNRIKKEFIINNIENPKFEDLEKSIYNYYMEMTSRKFYKIFRDRINNGIIKSTINRIIEKFDNNIFILTDIVEFPKEYQTINIEDVDNLEKNSLVILVYNKDFLATEIANQLRNKNIRYISLSTVYPMARYFHIDKNAYDVLDEEAKYNTSWHFCPGDFENIFQALKNTSNLEGDVVEIGTFKGDSGSALLNYMKKTNNNKRAYFIDTYEGFTYDEAKNSQDIYWQNTHQETSLEKVKKRFEKYENANVVKSNIIKDALPKEIEKISFANIDVDMYEAVKASLYKVKDKIVKNGIIIAEDYGHTPGLLGAQEAVNEFLIKNPNEFIQLYFSSGQMFLIKK